MGTKAHVTDKVKLLVNVMSEFEGKQIEKGQIGTVVGVLWGPERYQVNFAGDVQSAADGLAYCSLTLKPDQFELASPSSVVPAKKYAGGMREIE
jgi:hypothetical protein